MNQAPISFKLSVWVTHPGPPQIRARAINAHGSSFQPSRPAIRCCFVDTSTGSDAPAMFPANGQLKRRPLHSAGSFGRVPPPQRYYGTLRLPAAHLAALRFLRLAIPVSGGQGVSHYGGQGEPPLRGGCARVPRSKCPQPPVKGTWSEPQVDDQGGSVLPAIMAHFLSAIDNDTIGVIYAKQTQFRVV